MGSEESKSNVTETDGGNKDTTASAADPNTDPTTLTQSISNFLDHYKPNMERLNEIMKELEKCQSSIQKIEKNANAGRSVAGTAAFMGNAAEMMPEEMAAEMVGAEMAEDADDILSALTFFTDIFAPVARFTVGVVQKLQTQKTHQAIVSLVVELKKLFVIFHENLQRVEGDLGNLMEKLKSEPGTEMTSLFGVFELKSSLSDSNSALKKLLKTSQTSQSETRESLDECLEKLEQLTPKLQQFLDQADKE